MAIRIVETDESREADRVWAEQFGRLSGFAWPPKNSAEWMVILIRAGFDRTEIKQFLATVLDNPGFADAGELPRGYISASGGDWPTFSAVLIAGLEQWRKLNPADATAESLPAEIRSAAPDDSATLVERAVATKVAHPGWTDQQVADSLGCLRETLYKPNMVDYKLAKKALKSGRDKYGRDSKSDRHRRPSSIDRRDRDDL